MSLDPLVRPAITREQLLALVDPLTVNNVKVALVGLRGFKGPNQHQQYDDAMCLISPDVFRTYNLNTDPSRDFPGVAVLQPGTYWYIKGMHGVSGPAPYLALRQASNVTILREGKSVPETDTPAARFWIDIHRGGYNTTSSLGCQTIWPDEWIEFRDKVFSELEFYRQVRVPYTLLDYPAKAQ